MAHATRVTRPRLQSIASADDYCLEVEFTDGSGGRVSLKDSIFSIPGLAPLRDPAAFAGATLGEYGWEAEWMDLDIQIGADTLLADLLDQKAQTPAERFTAWRIRNGLSLSAAGRELGLTTRTVSAYGSGARPIPRTVQLACVGWEVEQQRRFDPSNEGVKPERSNDEMAPEFADGVVAEKAVVEYDAGKPKPA